MKKAHLLVGLTALLIIIISAFYWIKQGKHNSESVLSENQTESLPNNEKVGESVDSVELKAVGGYEGSGTANRDYNGTSFVHLVVAQLKDPGEGKFYEGWLVKKEPTLTYISTGKLEQQGGNGQDFALLFTSKTDYSDHTDVIITEETGSLGQDNNPEAHVLEGSFSN